MDLLKNKNYIYAFLGLALVIWFSTIDSMRLLKNDEGRYAEIPREMLESGDYVTPRLNTIKYFEKPPLQYWTTAFFFYVLGEKEWVSRLWTVLTGALTLIVLFYYCSTVWTPERAILTTLILASSPLFIAIGHINVLDMGLTFFLTLSLVSLLELIQDNIERKKRITLNLIFWISTALSLLSKGLISFLLPAMVAFFYTFIRRDFKFLKNIAWLWGIPLFLAISAPWFILVSLRNPEFFHFFFIHEHFVRFLSKGHGRQGPIWYFIPLFVFGFFPWSTLFFQKLSKVKFENNPDGKRKTFLIIWTVSIFIFFSVSSSKLPHYILPIFPSLAILASDKLFNCKIFPVKRIFLSYILFSILGIVGYFYLINKSTDFVKAEHYTGFANYLLFFSVFLIFTSATLFIIKNKFESRTLLLLSSILGSLFFQGLYFSYKELAPSVTGHETAKAIIPYLKPNTLVYTIGDYEQSIPFYIKRKLILVDYIGEMKFGIDNEKIHYHSTMDSFFNEWPSVKEAIIITDSKNLSKIESIKSSLSKIFEDNQRIVFIKSQEPK